MRLVCIPFILALLGSCCFAQSVFSLGKSGSSGLREIDPTTGATLSNIPLPGLPFGSGQGLAVDPTTGIGYVIDITGGNRNLHSLDLTTGATTLIGNTARNIAGIAISATGTLYGIEGTFSTAGNLVEIDKTTAAVTPLASLGNPNAGGEEIAVSPIDGLIYRFDNSTLTSIDPNAGFAQTAIATPPVGEITAMGFDSNGDILAASFVTLHRITTTGVSTLIGNLDHISGDLAHAPVPVPYPGTGEDLLTEISTNGGPFAGMHTVTLVVGDSIAIRHLSPGGTFDLLEFVAFGSVAPIGTPAFSPFPGLHFLVGGVTYATVSGGVVGGIPFLLPPGGVAYAGVHVGGALSGASTLIQGASLTSTAANSIFASTDGLLIEFL